MSKPIVVGYDPETSDRAPVNFGVAAARFTGAPLIVASASAEAAAGDRPAAGQHDEELVVDASGALDAARRELEPEGIAVDCRELSTTSAARALHELSESRGRRPARRRLDQAGRGRARAARLDGRAPHARSAVPDRDRPARLGGRRRPQHDRGRIRRQRRRT